jgi:hypothetical protein
VNKPLQGNGGPGETPTDSAEPGPADTGPTSDGDAGAPGACQQEDDSSAPDTGSSTQDPPAGPKKDESSAANSTQTEQQLQEKEYQKKVDERNDNIKKGQQKVRELNGRFADWYYVISEDVYKKVHLSRADIVKSKEGGEGVGVDSFRKLEEEGLPKP